MTEKNRPGAFVEKPDRYTKGRRIMMMLGRNIIAGFAIGLFRLSAFGIDPFASMYLGMSYLTHISFGTCTMIIGAVMLAVQFIWDRHTVGIGTFVNMFVGYVADAAVWLSNDYFHIEYLLWGRILVLLLGTALITLGVAMYMDAKLGIPSAQGLALVLQKAFHNKLSFRLIYTFIDLTAVAAGIVFCLLAHVSIWNIIGVGTIAAAVVTGPGVAWWSEHVTTEILGENPDSAL